MGPGNMEENLSTQPDPIALFRMYMQVTGVPTLSDAPCDDPLLRGKRLGIVNGSSWTTLWSNYFGRMALPGVKLVNAGNEAVQLNFMDAHRRGRECPPQSNIEVFARYATDLVTLAGVHAILISCSTMNRAVGHVADAVARYHVPVMSIDEPIMEQAVLRGGDVLVVATHGPTVKSTQELLGETAARLGRDVSFTGATVEACFELLGSGDIEGHNELIAREIRTALRSGPIATVVLAQLSMSVFSFSYPDPIKEFGVPVLTSGVTGFERVREVLRNLGNTAH